LISDLLEGRVRERSDDPASRFFSANEHQLPGVLDRKKPPQKRINKTEDRGVRADAKGKQHDRDNADPGVPGQHPGTESQIL